MKPIVGGDGETTQTEATMQVHAFRDPPQESKDSLDRETLLASISSLREELSAIRVAMRGMQRENLQLKQELSEQADGDAEGWAETPSPSESVSKLNRVREELDLMVQLYDAAKLREGPRPRRARRQERMPARAGAQTDRSAWLRNMMMFMMISELL